MSEANNITFVQAKTSFLYRPKEKWGFAESLRANPILFRFPLLHLVSFRRVLVSWSEGHHLYMTITRLSAIVIIL